MPSQKRYLNSKYLDEIIIKKKMKLTISLCIFLGYLGELTSIQGFELKKNNELCDQSDLLAQLRGSDDRDCRPKVICKKVLEPVDTNPVELQED